MIFHPGGYRNIITEPGENKEDSYKKQLIFLKKICDPIFRANLLPIIKIHPLAARFHDYADVLNLKKIISSKRKVYKDLIILKKDTSFFDYALRSEKIITFGSSSIYELWSMGFFNVYVCDFISNSRSKKFEMFKNIIIKNAQQYESLLNRSFKQSKNDFFYSVAQEFYKLNRFNSIDNIIKYILKNLRTHK